MARYLVYLAALVPAAAFNVSSVFGSHMVLQRDVPAPIWGNAASGSVVKVTLNGATYTATADALTQWVTTLPATPAGGPFTLIVSGSDGSPNVTLTDVLFGDVFFCNGQSNQDMPVGYAFNASAEAAAGANYPSIRLFGVNPNSSAIPLTNLPRVVLPWTPASEDAGAVLLGFSAVCWFMGRGVYDGLKGAVPVGLIHSALGGTPIQAWSSSAAAAQCAAVPSIYAESVLYNAMMAPFTVGPLAMRGWLWYQGEQNCEGGSDSVLSSYYMCALGALINDWRVKFGVADALSTGRGVFAAVQLHPWNATEPTYSPGILPLIRQAQLLAPEALSTTVIATAIDGGDPYAPATSIHPRGKQIPGYRAANGVLAVSYGMDVPYLPPRYESASVATVAQRRSDLAWEDVSVTVQLGPPAALATGLVWRPPVEASNATRCPTDLDIGAQLCEWFGIMADDAAFPNGTWYNATASINADNSSLTLTATLPAGRAAAGTRNGWAAWPVVNVYSGAGLPLLTWQEAL